MTFPIAVVISIIACGGLLLLLVVNGNNELEKSCNLVGGKFHRWAFIFSYFEYNGCKVCVGKNSRYSSGVRIISSSYPKGIGELSIVPRGPQDGFDFDKLFKVETINSSIDTSEVLGSETKENLIKLNGDLFKITINSYESHAWSTIDPADPQKIKLLLNTFLALQNQLIKSSTPNGHLTKG